MTAPGYENGHQPGPVGGGSVFDGLKLDILDGIFNLVETVFIKVPALIVAGLIEFGKKTFEAIFSFATWDDDKDVFANFKDGQKQINDRIDLISPLLNYACLHMPNGIHEVPIKWVRLPFTEQLGPVRGVEIKDDGLVLLEKGLWDIRAHLAWVNSKLKLSDNTEAIILCIRPGKTFDPNSIKSDGDEAADPFQKDDSAYSILHVWNHQVSTHTDAWNMTLVVDEPGYKIEVWARGSQASADSPRHVYGNETKSRLVAQQISYTTATRVLEAVKPLDPANKEG